MDIKDTKPVKRRPGRPATGRRDAVTLAIYLPPDLDAAVREKISRTGQSITNYFETLARQDLEQEEQK